MKYLPTINYGKYVFVHFLIIRLLSVWFVRTWYVPDEYWQSLEVAHNFVFGYGYLTWEWQKGIRSYLHPLLISIIYQILAWLHLDTVQLLVVLPRIAQAILSAFSDFCFYKWCGRKKWAIFSITTEWFWFYTASRTLINTFETAMTTIALSIFPWRGSKAESENKTHFIWIVGFLVAMRPTAAIQWIPLCLFHVYDGKGLAWQIILRRYIPIGIAILATTIAIDSVCYGRLIITPWEFLKVNVINEIGSFYGSLPFYWYFTVGLPTILGVHVLPFSWSAIKIIQNRAIKPNHMALLSSILFTLVIYSLLPHKEFRFILPLVPMTLYISVDFLAPWSAKANRLHIWLVAITILTASCAPIYYLSNTHQRGAIDLMPILENIAAKRPKSTNFLFLMPCHSTPLYSHLHVNVSTRFLTCEPDFTNNPEYKDEADQFYDDPRDWLARNYPQNATLPSHIIVFDHLHSQSSLFARYKEIHTLHHTDVPSGRVGTNIIVHQHAHFEQNPS